MFFVLRWLFAFVLLAATTNPTGYDYVTWVRTAWDTDTPMVILGGLLLAVGYIVYLRATLRSIGVPGMIFVAAIMATALWVLYDFNLLKLDNAAALHWIGLLAVSLVLGIGLSWSLVRRRLSGQLDVDDVDE